MCYNGSIIQGGAIMMRILTLVIIAASVLLVACGNDKNAPQGKTKPQSYYQQNSKKAWTNPNTNSSYGGSYQGGQHSKSP
jgi:outer membrane biogenesis lipoprotein LolB